MQGATGGPSTVEGVTGELDFIIAGNGAGAGNRDEPATATGAAAAKKEALSRLRAYDYVEITLRKGKIRGLFLFVDKKTGKYHFWYDAHNDAIGYAAVSENNIDEIRIIPESVLNTRPILNTAYLVAHGTNAYSLIQAVKNTNSQLRPAGELPEGVYAGESIDRGPAEIDNDFVSSFDLNTLTSSLYDAWERYAKNAATTDKMTRKKVEALISVGESALANLTGGSEENEPIRQKISAHLTGLKKIKDKLFGMSEQQYRDYEDLSGIRVCIIGDGVAEGRCQTDLSNVSVYRRINIRAVGVEGEDNVKKLNELLNAAGVSDILVIEINKLTSLVEQHKHAVSHPDPAESQLVRLIKENNSDRHGLPSGLDNSLGQGSFTPGGSGQAPAAGVVSSAAPAAAPDAAAAPTAEGVSEPASVGQGWLRRAAQSLSSSLASMRGQQIPETLENRYLLCHAVGYGERSLRTLLREQPGFVNRLENTIKSASVWGSGDIVSVASQGVIFAVDKQDILSVSPRDSTESDYGFSIGFRRSAGTGRARQIIKGPKPCVSIRYFYDDGIPQSRTLGSEGNLE